MRIFRRVAGVNYLPPVHRHPACWLLLLVGLLPACATFQPTPVEQVPFRERAVTQRQGAVQVSAVVLSAEESAAVFGGINVLSGQVTKWKAASRRMDSPRSFGHLRDYLHQRWCISPLFFFPDEVQHLVK
jgi:hypothetical protein